MNSGPNMLLPLSRVIQVPYTQKYVLWVKQIEKQRPSCLPLNFMLLCLPLNFMLLWKAHGKRALAESSIVVELTSGGKGWDDPF